jgi:hypothetical protein
MSRKRKPRFLNVDLVLESRRSLAPMIDAWGRKAMVLYHERRKGIDHATLEVSTIGDGPNACIRAFVRLIDALPPRLRSIWNAARRRDLDVGIEMGLGRFMPIVGLSAETVRRAAAVDARIVVTVYPPLTGAGGRILPHPLE